MRADTSVRRQLAMAAAVADKIRTDPDRCMALGRRNLERMRQRPSAAVAGRWLDEWQAALASGPSAVIAALLDPTDHGHDMRQMTPFAGVLSNEERWAILREVYREVA